MDTNETADIRPPSFREGLSHALRTLGLIWDSSRGLTLIVAFLTIIVATTPLAAAAVSQLIVDSVIAAIDTGTSADRETAIIWVAIEAAILTLLLAARRMMLFFKARLHAELGYAVNTLILEKSARFDLQQIERPDIQQQLVLARQHAANRPYSLVNRLFSGVQNALTLVGAALLLFSFSPWLIALVIGGGLPLFLGDLLFSGTAFKFYTGRTPQMRERSYLESLLTGDALAQERLHYGTGPAIMDRYNTLFSWLYVKDRSLQARRAFAQTALGIVSSMVFLGGKVMIVLATIESRISLGQMTMLVTLLKQGQSAVTGLLASFNGAFEDILYVSNLYALLDTSETFVTGGPAGQQSDTVPTATAPRGLCMTDVTFTYPGQKKPALDRVSLSIPPGSRVGIVGANGSGKSTLIKLLIGLYTPQSGQVCLDGQSIAQWDRASLGRRIGAMFQPFTRYKLSARDNIAAGLGLTAIDDKDLFEAAESGLAKDLIHDLPAGLDTRLSKRFLDGRELSGGQWQRLAMARAFVNKQADILILDEPTAAMDPLAEAEFMTRDFGDKTCILISHRLSNIRQADLILVLDEGRLIETGTHETLMLKGGLYARLFHTQAENYKNS